MITFEQFLILILIVLIWYTRTIESMCLCGGGQLPGTHTRQPRAQQQDRIRQCAYPPHMAGVV